MTIERPKNGWDIKGVTTHPGAVLREDFLKPMGMNANSLSLKLRVPVTRLQQIVNERRAVTPDTAMRLARYFGTSVGFWLNLQLMYEFTKAKQEIGSVIDREVEPHDTVAA